MLRSCARAAKKCQNTETFSKTVKYLLKNCINLSQRVRKLSWKRKVWKSEYNSSHWDPAIKSAGGLVFQQFASVWDHVMCTCIRQTLLCPHPVGGGALSGHRRPSSVRPSDVAYIGSNSKTKRPRKTKLCTGVPQVTCDSQTDFKVKRSKVKVSRGGGILWRPPSRTACYTSAADVFVSSVSASVPCSLRISSASAKILNGFRWICGGQSLPPTD